MRLSVFALLTTVALLTTHPGFAESQSGESRLGIPDPRGPAEVVFCSQNLLNYAGAEKPKPGQAPFVSDKERALVARFARAGCDVIGLQEVRVPANGDPQGVLRRLITLLNTASGRQFDSYTDDFNSGPQRMALLYAKDRAEISSTTSYRKVRLARLDQSQKPREFPRPPFEVQLLVKGRDGAPDRKISVIVIHFKSKGGGELDPVGIEWETARMEAADSIRRIVEDRHLSAARGAERAVIVMGDRNSNFDTASAAILEGTLTLADFRDVARCRLSKRGVPLCQAETAKPKNLFSVITADPQTKLQSGTYVFNKQYSWIDDILVSRVLVGTALADPATEGDYDSGVMHLYPDASDHALVWVRLNW